MKQSAALDAVSDLIVVACHAPFKETTLTVPENLESDEAWVLQSFQRGEPPLYIQHIRRGVELLAAQPAALLIFSGGYTRVEAGLRWSEADTYAAIARHFNWWATASNPAAATLEARIALEDFSRDSFENLLFSICRFQRVTGRYPRRVTIVSWEFKRARFDLHRDAIRLPSGRFSFEGCNNPLDLKPALRSEAETFAEFQRNPYGSSGRLAAKRADRNPFHRRHNFPVCAGLQNFFRFIEDPANDRKDFPELLPWEEQEE